MRLDVIGALCDHEEREINRKVLFAVVVRRYKHGVIMSEMDYQICMGVLFHEFPLNGKDTITLKMYLSDGYMPEELKIIGGKPYVYFEKKEGMQA